MPNGIKYTTGAIETGCLKKSNMLIANNTADYGSTFYSGITPPSGGYTVYLNKATGGPSIYCPSNDSQLISLTNSIAGSSYTTAAQCLNYFAGQSDKLCVNLDYEGIVTNGLVLNLDAGFTPSYPTSGTTWYDLSGNNNNGTLNNGPTFNSGNSGSIVFDGVDDGVSMSSGINTYSQLTCEIWIKANPSNIGGSLVAAWALGIEGQWRMLYGLQSFSWVCRGGNGWYSPGTSIDYDYGSSINNIWFHVVGTYNGTFNSIYVNGTLQTTGSNIQGSAGGGSMSIAATNAPSNIAYGKGNFSNVRLYSRALSAAEVLQNYNATKSRFGL